MRQVIYRAAISLDGFLAGPGESIDWLRHSDESAKVIAASFEGVDTMLMGRKTFEFALAHGAGGRADERCHHLRLLADAGVLAHGSAR